MIHEVYRISMGSVTFGALVVEYGSMNMKLSLEDKSKILDFLKQIAGNIKKIGIGLTGDGKISEEGFQELVHSCLGNYGFLFEPDFSAISIISFDAHMEIARLFGVAGGDLYSGDRLYLEVNAFVFDGEFYVHNKKIGTVCSEKHVFFFRDFYVLADKGLRKIDCSGKTIWKNDLKKTDLKVDCQFTKFYGLCRPDSSFSSTGAIGVEKYGDVYFFDVSNGIFIEKYQLKLIKTE